MHKYFSVLLKSIYPFGLSVRPSVHALTVVNILQMLLNLYIVIKFDTEWTVLKMICIGLSVRLETHQSCLIHFSLSEGGG